MRADSSDRRKIKIAHVRWGEVFGGAERILYDLAREYDKDRFEFRFYFLRHGGPFEVAMRANGVFVSVIDARNGYDVKMRWELIRQLRGFHPDIVHEHGVPPLVRPLISLVTGSRLLSFSHGEIEINRCKGKPWLNWLNRVEHRMLAHRIIANSEFNAGLVQRTYGLPSDRVVVIYPGVDLRRFAADWEVDCECPYPGLVLGYVGRMQNYDKGTDFLPQVARELSDRGVEFRMKLVGDGPDRKRLETLGCQLGVADRMEFCGHHDDIPKLMASMDILVVPSRTEAFGLVAIEALAAGTRVVAFKLGGLNEVLANCSEARLVPPWDVPAMSEAILDLWYQHGKSHSVEGRRYVAARFDARRMVREMEQVYLEIVGLGKL